MLRTLVKYFAIILITLTILFVLVVLYFHSTISRRETCKPSTLPQTTSGKTIDVGGQRIFYQEAGPVTGIPVMLIHGTGSWSEIWRETMTALSGKGYHVFALDIPPFGFSAKPVGVNEYTTGRQAQRLNEFVVKLQLDSVVMVAHSVGARAATEAVLSRSSAYQKLILIDPALSFPEDSTVEGFQANDPSLITRSLFANKFVRNSLIAAFGSNPSFTKKSFQSFVWNKEGVTDSKVKMINEPLCIQGITNGYGDWFENLMCGNSTCLITDTANLAVLNIPVVLIWGEKDDITPLWQGKRLQQYFSHASLLTIAHSGHIPYIETPGEFQKLLAAALAD